MEIKPICADFGALISDVDLASITDTDFKCIYEAWLTYGVLCFRDQVIDKDNLQTFSQRFGPLEEMPVGRLTKEQRAKIDNIFVTPISNIIKNGKPIGALGNKEVIWHSDMTYSPVPPPASVLLAVEVPENGGNTYYADQRAAYDRLPKALKARIKGLTIKHDASHVSDGTLRRGYDPVDDPRDAPGTIHPIVRVHDETGDACLYLGRRDWAYIPGLTLEDSEALLDEIWSYAIVEGYVFEHQWAPGDILVWDNRRCIHRRSSLDPSARRLLFRCQVLAREQSDADT